MCSKVRPGWHLRLTWASLWMAALFFAGQGLAQLAVPRHVPQSSPQSWKPESPPPESPPPQSLIGIQYALGFYGPQSWKTAEAVPLLGKYTTDSALIAQHFAEFQQLGFDWLLIDWSNMLRMNPVWEQHAGETRRLEDKTAILFETARKLRQQGKYAPRLVFMLGLQNGLPVPNGVERLNGILAWIKQNYLDRPEFKDLWLYEGGKPLLTILYVTRDPCAELNSTTAGAKLETQDWTLRWITTQLQSNHAEHCGMWSWMDGDVPQILTRKGGVAEEIVVTPSAFQLQNQGWTAPSAIARDHGVPYLESWKAAFAARPRYVQVHQWNEFAGRADVSSTATHAAAVSAPKPPSPAYYDEYDVQRSDDLEPTDPQACGYRSCGGWGYYYYNLTRAVISLYRGTTSDITVLALARPTAPVGESIHSLDLHWAFLGKAPSSYSIALDGKVMAASLTGSTYTLDLTHVPRGEHRVLLTAAGVQTRFSLDPLQPAVLSAKPLAVTAEVTFVYE